MVADIHLEAAEEVARRSKTLAKSRDFRAEAIYIDVTKEDSVQNMANETVQLFGRIDYCVNSAGVSKKYPCNTTNIRP